MQVFSERFCMIDMNQVIRRIQEAPFHIYDLAMYDHGTVSFHRFEPCSVSNNSYSVAKVFLMTAVGFLYDMHTISMSDRVCDILGDLVPQHIDPAWKLVTIDHALTHRIGFREGFLDIDLEDASVYPTQDYLSMVFSRPLAYNPGEKYVYSDAAFYLLSRIVSKLTGVPADRFLMDRLFAPMRFREVAWSHCPMGFPIGATGLYISTPDMLKIALLYMHDGVYENQRYLSSQWVRPHWHGNTNCIRSPRMVSPANAACMARLLSFRQRIRLLLLYMLMKRRTSVLSYRCWNPWSENHAESRSGILSRASLASPESSRYTLRVQMHGHLLGPSYGFLIPCPHIFQSRISSVNGFTLYDLLLHRKVPWCP